MAKKGTVKQYGFAIAACLGILAIILFLIPMITYHAEIQIGGAKAYNEVSFSGFNLLAGAKEIKGITYNSLTDKTTDYSYSGEVKGAVGVVISFILTVVGILGAVASKFVDKKVSKIVKFVACGAFVVAGVLLVVLTKPTFVSANEIGENAAELYKLAFGAYLVAILNVGAGVVSLIA